MRYYKIYAHIISLPNNSIKIFRKLFAKVISISYLFSFSLYSMITELSSTL